MEGVSAINTIMAIMAVNLDTLSPEPNVEVGRCNLKEGARDNSACIRRHKALTFPRERETLPCV